MARGKSLRFRYRYPATSAISVPWGSEGASLSASRNAAAACATELVGSMRVEFYAGEELWQGHQMKAFVLERGDELVLTVHSGGMDVMLEND